MQHVASNGGPILRERGGSDLTGRVRNPTAHTSTMANDLTDLKDAIAQIDDVLRAARDDRTRGRLVEAMARFQEAERLCVEHRLKLGLLGAAAIQGQAVVLLDQGHAQEALDSCGRALARLGIPGGSFDDKPTRAALLTTTGFCLRTLGRYDHADEAYRMAIAYAEQQPGEPLAVAIANYGVLWSVLGDPAQALALYKDALHIIDKHAAESDQRAWILMNLGGALRDAGELVPALGALEEALAAERRRGSRRGQAQALLALSDCHQTAADLTTARRYAEEAREIVAQDAARSEMHARCLRQLSELAVADGDLPAALDVIREAANIIAAIAPDSRDAIDTGCALALLLCGTGDIDDGIGAARNAHEVAERVRREAPAGMTRQTITAITGHAADVYAATLMIRAAGGADARAFVDVLERRQARRLVDKLGVGSTDALPPDAMAEIRRLREARREPGRVLQHAHWALQAIEAGEDVPVPAEDARRARASARHALHVLDAAIDERLPAAGPVDALRCEEISRTAGAGAVSVALFCDANGLCGSHDHADIAAHPTG